MLIHIIYSYTIPPIYPFYTYTGDLSGDGGGAAYKVEGIRMRL